jgi:UDP:flavonoid glycosyltransferase YjiC (YdhE family)
MQTIVFLPYHGIGHFNACFKIAKILQAGYNIVFAGLSLFEEYVEGQGFSYYSLQTVPFGLGLEPWLNSVEKKKNIYFHSLKDRWAGRLYKLREIDLTRLLEEVKPQCILIDYLQSTDVIPFYPHAKKNGIKIGFIQTMLPQIVRKNCPPINSLVFPDDRKEINKARSWFYFLRFAKGLGYKIKFFGMSNALMIKRRKRLNQMSEEYDSKEITPYAVPFNNIDEFILAPREFDFPQNSKSAFEHYVGFMPDEERNEAFDKPYKAIQKRLKASKDRLIYCSFGTVKLENTIAVESFIKRLISVVRNKRCFLLVSITATQHWTINDELPDNVLFLKSAPQLEILSKASLFITHGGLNSIKEAVYACVPMLVYPLNPKMDQKGNSTRVVFHQLGLRGNLQTDPEELIEKKIDELLQNPMYKQKMQELRIIDRTYTAERFIELFDTLTPLT